MNKRVLLGIAMVTVGVFVWASAYSQEDITHIDHRMFSQPQRPSAIFNHDEHNEKAEIEACNECHHVYEDGQKLEDESSEDQQCMECHEINDIDRRPGLMKAYHLNCKGCHLKAKKGPILCGECHVKE